MKFILLLLLPIYWPGVDGGAYDVLPIYGDRIPVIDTIDVRDRKAFQDWNDCGSVQLFVSNKKPYSPGSITITTGKVGDFPRGGWFGDHGIVFLPPGTWERSLPVIRHEIGHALGFGHTDRASVMGGKEHVTALDCAGLKYYYS